MAHQAIYRRWRPMTFDDVVGQNHITKTLKNQILSDTVAHAYLFCGTRGTGKTTCAKVLARAVNCTDPKNGNPCNECAVCKGIIDGSIMDVTEIDAASNNGVDTIRDIKDDISYLASNTKYTVYIIDEVHMLSQGAFNALLKTLEEPPKNVIFILATTEPHKVPQTILSRCQRFDFKRIKPDDIIVRMKEIAHADGYSITDSAYHMLASLADGSMRDGLSIMERVISSGGDSIDDTDIINALGISTIDSAFEMTDAIINGDSAAVIKIIEKTISEGKELTRFAEVMLEHFRSLMITKLSDDPKDLLDCDANTLVKIKSQGEKITFEKLDLASTLISTAIADARFSASPRIIFELAFIKLTKPELENSQKSVVDRISALEQKLEGEFSAPQVTVTPSSDSSELIKRIDAIEKALADGIRPVGTEREEEKPKKKKVSHRLYVPIPKDELYFDHPTATLARNWKKTVEVMARRNYPFATPLKNCVVTFDAEGIIILVPDDRIGFTDRIFKNHIDKIRELFRSITHSDYGIKFANRQDLDDSMILNPFELPKRQQPKESSAETHQEEETPTTDGLDEFIERFSDIITDGDRIDFSKPPQTGEQSSIDEEEYDKEEFLEERELPQDEEE